MVREANELLRAEKYPEALARFERAVAVFPTHAQGWKGVGQALLCLARTHEAARAFDQAIGHAPTSATALWGGALAHAEIGNRVVAQNYLRRTLAVQPTWITMAQGVPALAALLQTHVRAAELYQVAFGAMSRRSYGHASDAQRSIEVARIAGQPVTGQWTYATLGLSNESWGDARRARVELVLATSVDLEVCGLILANLAFHLAKASFYPAPATMVRDVVGSLAAGDLSRRLPHVYIRAPRGWRVKLPLDVGPPAITLAQAFPISEAEYQSWRTVGADRFEHEIIDRNIDVADLRRS
jgi:hypothetical protein